MTGTQLGMSQSGPQTLELAGELDEGMDLTEALKMFMSLQNELTMRKIPFFYVCFGQPNHDQ